MARAGEMVISQVPAHLRRSIIAFRTQPLLFYNRTPVERQFFLDQLMNWLDRFFSPTQPPVAYQLRARSLTITEQRDLEIRILRYIREFIFSPDRIIPTPSSDDWFVYAFLRQLS